MKIALISTFVFLVLLALSCDNPKYSEDTMVSTEENLLFQKSKNKELDLHERLAAIDSFLIMSRASADTLNILKGLGQKTYLLGVGEKYDIAISSSHELLTIAEANKNSRHIRIGYDKISRYYSKIEEYDMSIFYAEKLVEFSKKDKDSSALAKAYFRIGTYKQKQHKLSESFRYFNDAFLIRRSKKDSVRAMKTLLQMARIQKKLSDYRASQVTAIDGLEFLNASSKIEDIVGIYQNISVTNRELEDYEEALNFNGKALDIETRDEYILTLKNTQANIFSDLGEYKKAENILRSLLSDSLLISNKKERARISSNLGYVKWLENETNNESEELLLSGLKLREEEKDISGLIASYTHLTKYYTNINKELALAYAEKIYKNAKRLNNRIQIIESIRMISLLKNELGQFISNELTIEQSNVYKYIQKANNETEKIYADTKFQNTQLIEQKLQSDEEKKRQKLIFIGIGLLLLISAAFLFFLLKLKHKREKAREVIKETYQTERRLSKKVHDELANDLSDTLNLIDSQKAIPNDIKEQLVNKIDDLYDRTRDISAEIDGFDSKDFARSLKFLITQHNTEGVKVITNVTSGINWDTISDHKKINIYRSLQELLVNMKKYSKATEVTVIFKSEGKRHFINYTDNGVGVILKDVRKRGLQNVETRIKNIQGSITFKTSKGKGFKAHLYF